MDPANASNYYAPYANGSPMITKYNTFQTLSNSNSMTMDEFASYTHKCASQFASNQTSNSSCTNFCFPLSNATSQQITQMQNQEWNTLKALYYSEKQKLLYKYQNAKRLVSPSCNYYNACIGVPDFDGYNTPMVKYNTQNLPIPSSPYFNCKQPCNQTIKDLYANKEKRFGHVEDADFCDSIVWGLRYRVG